MVAQLLSEWVVSFFKNILAVARSDRRSVALRESESNYFSILEVPPSVGRFELQQNAKKTKYLPKSPPNVVGNNNRYS